MKKGRSLENGNMNQIYAAKTNHITNPVGFLLNPVVFSWKVRDCRGKNQRCARILVAKDETFADVLWDTGEAKLDSLAVKAEMNLEPCTRYYWKVIVTTDADEVLESEVQFFETAKRDEPWAGKWITCDSREARHPIFSKQITLRKKVKKARLYICGLGLYEAYFTDGDKDQTDIPQSAKIGEEYLTPYCNNYNQWLQYQTYDVTAQMQREGVLSVLLGNGWYKGRFGFNQTEQKGFYGDEWKLLAEVHLDYFGRGYRRSIELFCRDGSYLADFGKGTLTLPDGTVQHYEEDVNRRYEREMEYFVDYALTGCGESCNPPALALKVLKLTLGENVQ